jgi:hypothetical protein
MIDYILHMFLIGSQRKKELIVLTPLSTSEYDNETTELAFFCPNRNPFNVQKAPALLMECPPASKYNWLFLDDRKPFSMQEAPALLMSDPPASENK